MDRMLDECALRTRLLELEAALRKPGGISILEERELLAIRRALDRSRITVITQLPSAAPAT